MRDTGAAQSLILKTAVPEKFKFTNNEFVVLGGFPNSISSYPLEEMYVKSKYFSGMAKLAVVGSLPVPGIHLLLGNDLASNNDNLLLPILIIASEVGVLNEPVSVVTRSKS